jgi:prevent-host-death family protein
MSHATAFAPGTADLPLINQAGKLDGMKPDEVGAFEAKTRLSELLYDVARGRTYVITKRGRPVAELRPLPTVASPALAFGCDRGRVVVGDGFEAPLAEFADYEQ